MPQVVQLFFPKAIHRSVDKTSWHGAVSRETDALSRTSVRERDWNNEEVGHPELALASLIAILAPHCVKTNTV